jgi:FKBP-type peptidyl-prolyl cis-trans isomerase 2
MMQKIFGLLGFFGFLFLLTLSACSEPLAVKVGDKVTVHYHGTLENGDVFDSSREREPLSFVVGSGSMIKGFDEAVKGLQIDDIVTVKLSPEDAYGVKDESLIFEVPSEGAPAGLNVGDRVQLQGGMRATVASISDSKIRLDANHELAGVPLIFEIEVILIERN